MKPQKVAHLCTKGTATLCSIVEPGGFVLCSLFCPFLGEGITLLIYFLKCDKDGNASPEQAQVVHTPLVLPSHSSMVNSHCILVMHTQNATDPNDFIYACLGNLSIFPLQQVLIKFKCKFSPRPVMLNTI